MNWAGKPLTSHQVIIDLIGATTTRTGLKVHPELDDDTYPTGIKISDTHKWQPCPSTATNSTATGTTPSNPTNQDSRMLNTGKP